MGGKSYSSSDFSDLEKILMTTIKKIQNIQNVQNNKNEENNNKSRQRYENYIKQRSRNQHTSSGDGTENLTRNNNYRFPNNSLAYNSPQHKYHYKSVYQPKTMFSSSSQGFFFDDVIEYLNCEFYKNGSNCFQRNKYKTRKSSHFSKESFSSFHLSDEKNDSFCEKLFKFLKDNFELIPPSVSRSSQTDNNIMSKSAQTSRINVHQATFAKNKSPNLRGGQRKPLTIPPMRRNTTKSNVPPQPQFAPFQTAPKNMQNNRSIPAPQNSPKPKQLIPNLNDPYQNRPQKTSKFSSSLKSKFKPFMLEFNYPTMQEKMSFMRVEESIQKNQDLSSWLLDFPAVEQTNDKFNKQECSLNNPYHQRKETAPYDLVLKELEKVCENITNNNLDETKSGIENSGKDSEKSDCKYSLNLNVKPKTKESLLCDESSCIPTNFKCGPPPTDSEPSFDKYRDYYKDSKKNDFLPESWSGWPSNFKYSPPPSDTSYDNFCKSYCQPKLNSIKHGSENYPISPQNMEHSSSSAGSASRHYTEPVEKKSKTFGFSSPKTDVSSSSISSTSPTETKSETSHNINENLENIENALYLKSKFDRQKSDHSSSSQHEVLCSSQKFDHSSSSQHEILSGHQKSVSPSFRQEFSNHSRKFNQSSKSPISNFSKNDFLSDDTTKTTPDSNNEAENMEKSNANEHTLNENPSIKNVESYNISRISTISNKEKSKNEEDLNRLKSGTDNTKTFYLKPKPKVDLFKLEIDDEFCELQKNLCNRKSKINQIPSSSLYSTACIFDEESKDLTLIQENFYNTSTSIKLQNSYTHPEKDFNSKYEFKNIWRKENKSNKSLKSSQSWLSKPNLSLFELPNSSFENKPSNMKQLDSNFSYNNSNVIFRSKHNQIKNIGNDEKLEKQNKNQLNLLKQDQSQISSYYKFYNDIYEEEETTIEQYYIDDLPLYKFDRDRSIDTMLPKNINCNRHNRNVIKQSDQNIPMRGVQQKIKGPTLRQQQNKILLRNDNNTNKCGLNCKCVAESIKKETMKNKEKTPRNTSTNRYNKNDSRMKGGKTALSTTCSTPNTRRPLRLRISPKDYYPKKL